MLCPATFCFFYYMLWCLLELSVFSKSATCCCFSDRLKLRTEELELICVITPREYTESLIAHKKDVLYNANDTRWIASAKEDPPEHSTKRN